MKILKHILVALTLTIILVIGFRIYFDGQLSSTYLPIETYTLDFTKNEFEIVLKEIDSQKEFKLTFTDTTGLDLDSEHSFYFNILNNRNNDKYLLKFKSDKNIIRGEKIKLELIGLHNQSTNKVIYEPDDEAKKVRVKFESELLEKLKN